MARSDTPCVREKSLRSLALLHFDTLTRAERHEWLLGSSCRCVDGACPAGPQVFCPDTQCHPVSLMRDRNTTAGFSLTIVPSPASTNCSTAAAKSEAFILRIMRPPLSRQRLQVTSPLNERMCCINTVASSQ